MSSILPTPKSGQPPPEIWATAAPYVVPPIAAAAAIILPFRDLIGKTYQQNGLPIPPLTIWNGVKEGLVNAPKVGAIIGIQMGLQKVVEKAIGERVNPERLTGKLLSSAVVGIISSPFLAVFNGGAAKLSTFESIRRLSVKQCGALAVQETAFVGGLTAADLLAQEMKLKFGDNKAVEYSAAVISGAGGSLAGHFANTAVTRWQNELQVEGFRQLWWGAFRKARAIGIFSVLYKLAKDVLNPTGPSSI